MSVEPKYGTPLLPQVVSAVRETSSASEPAPILPAPPVAAPKPTENVTVQSTGTPEIAPAAQPQAVALSASVYDAVKPLIVQALDKPKNLDDLAKALKIRKTQLQDWVKILLKEGVLEERVRRKVKKLAVRKPEEELKLK